MPVKIVSGKVPACGSRIEIPCGETVSPCHLERGHGGEHEGWCLGSRARWDDGDNDMDATEYIDYCLDQVLVERRREIKKLCAQRSVIIYDEYHGHGYSDMLLGTNFCSIEGAEALDTAFAKIGMLAMALARAPINDNGLYGWVMRFHWPEYGGVMLPIKSVAAPPALTVRNGRFVLPDGRENRFVQAVEEFAQSIPAKSYCKAQKISGLMAGSPHA